jgi:hypothetical protein
LLFRLFFVEFGAAYDGVGFRFFLGLFVLGFDETGGERGDLIFVQFNVIPDSFDAVTSRLLRRLDDGTASGGSFFGRAGDSR